MLGPLSLCVGLALLASAPTLAETLEIPGLSAPATVHTDTLGVPHIVAETLEDAVRAQGWVHARDRFFQLDVGRRQFAGTLAELTGSIDAIGADDFLRPFGLRAAAERSASRLGAEEAAIAQAYADGVNAWLATHPLPDEYAELELTTARRWTVVDSLVIAKGLSGVLDLFGKNDAATTDLFDSWIAAGVAAVPPFDGRVALEEDFRRYALHDPSAATVPDAGGSLPLASAPGGPGPLEFGPPSRRAAALARRYLERVEATPSVRQLARRGRASGSNAWGVAGAHTATGTPLVAGDPHLSIRALSSFYENHLIAREGAGSNLAGMSVPGLPLILLGHNGRVAWSFTDAVYDHVDWFEDRLVRDDPACPTRFCIDSAGALHRVEVGEQVIRRNLADDGVPDSFSASAPTAQLRVPFRSFGPVVEIEDPGILAGSGSAETTVLTLQSTMLHGTPDFASILGMVRAGDVFEFREALRSFDTLSVDSVVADTGGNLAYFSTGEVPLRADLEAGAPTGNPMWVRDGSGPANWVPDPARSQGQSIPFATLPFDELPQVVNPPNGFVVIANGDPLGVLQDNDPLNQFRASSPGSIYYLSANFGTSGYRPARITQLIRDKIMAAEPMTVDDMRAFQGNTQHRGAEIFLPYLLDAWTAAQQPGAPAELAAFASDPEVAEAAGRLAAWSLEHPTGLPDGYDAADLDGVPGPVTPEEEADSIAATIHRLWRAENRQITSVRAAREIDPSLAVPFGSAVPLLLAQVPFTGIGASGIDLFGGPVGLTPEDRRDVVLLQTLRNALDLLASDEFAPLFGNSTNQADYHWGKISRMLLEHPLGGSRNVPPAGGFTDLAPGLPGIARDGVGNAVNTSTGGFRPPEGARTFGGSVRLIMAPGHPAAAPDPILARASVAGGSSGDADSPLYMSQLPLWLTVDDHHVPFGEGEVSAFPTEDAVAVTPTKEQRSCVTSLGAKLVSVGKAQGKAAAKCLKDAAKGKEADPQACLTADAKGKVAKARDKALAIQEKKCSDATPLFAYAGAGDGSDGAEAESLALVSDLFGADLTLSALTSSSDQNGASCQGEVLKGAQKLVDSIWKAATKSTKGALAGKGGTAPATRGIEVHDAVAAAFASAKVDKSLAKLASKGGKKCADVADPGAAFPGHCGASADAAAVTSCAGERARCRACRALNATHALGLPCDVLDDGETDESC